MRTLLSYFTIAAMLLSCGEAGVGFNVSTEAPLSTSFDIDIPTTPEGLNDLLNINPPSQQLSYSLDGVDAFADDLDDLGDVVINAIYYQISDIEGEELNIDLDEFSITLIAGATQLPLVSQTNSLLSNVAKTEIDLTQSQLDNLRDQLLGGGEIGAAVVFDLASIPAGLTNLSIDYDMFFDVTIKVSVSD